MSPEELLEAGVLVYLEGLGVSARPSGSDIVAPASKHEK
jgi:hypothetical protein